MERPSPLEMECVENRRKRKTTNPGIPGKLVPKSRDPSSHRNSNVPRFSPDERLHFSWWAPLKEAADMLPSTTRAIIEEDNLCDLALYDHAR